MPCPRRLASALIVMAEKAENVSFVNRRVENCSSDRFVKRYIIVVGYRLHVFPAVSHQQIQIRFPDQLCNRRCSPFVCFQLLHGYVLAIHRKEQIEEKLQLLERLPLR